MSEPKNTQQKINISQVTDDLLRLGGRGTRSTILQDTARGLNIVGSSHTSIPMHRATGYVFFTRPLLNLTNNNISRERDFDAYLNSPENSYHRMARVYLDPWNERNKVVTNKQGAVTQAESQYEIIRSPLVDPYSPFINILTNNLLSLNGWPDIVINHYASDKGIMGEQWIMPDGHTKLYDNFRLSATFRNDDGDPIMLLMRLWLDYMSHARLGHIYPYPELLAARRMDCNTRIISFVMDSTRTYITHWSNCGVGFPVNMGSSTIFDYDVSQIHKENNEQKSIEFQCVGAEYNDLLTLIEFNKLVGKFNPDLDLYHPSMKGLNVTENGRDLIPKALYMNRNKERPPYVKLISAEKKLANFHAYPLVNVYTKELEWWMRWDDWVQYVVSPEIRLYGGDVKTFLNERNTSIK